MTPVAGSKYCCGGSISPFGPTGIVEAPVVVVPSNIAGWVVVEFVEALPLPFHHSDDDAVGAEAGADEDPGLLGNGGFFSSESSTGPELFKISTANWTSPFASTKAS